MYTPKHTQIYMQILPNTTLYTQLHLNTPQYKHQYLYRQFWTQGKGRAENILSLVIVIQWTWVNFF